MNMKRLGVLILVIMTLLVAPLSAAALTTADVTVTATPSFIAITVDPTSYDFGPVVVSDTPSTITSYFTITNTSSVQTDQDIRVTGATWAGGVTWAHDDTAAPGADTVGLKANKGGAWGVGDVIVKANAAFNYIAENQAATTNYSFGLKMWTPTSFGDGVQKSNTVRVTAAAG